MEQQILPTPTPNICEEEGTVLNARSASPRSSEERNNEIMTESFENFYEETEFIDYSHPLVSIVSGSLSSSLSTDKEKAIKAFMYVRDNIKFGLTGKISMMKASEVIIAKNVSYKNIL